MPDLTEPIARLARETPESIMARMIADVVAGLDPADPSYPDVIPGTFLNDVARMVALEADRIYDRHLEVIAAAIPASTYGEWVDAWASSVKLERKDETRATVVVQFTGAQDTIVPLSSQVSTVQAAADEDPVTFKTTTAATIPAGGTVDVPARAVNAGAAGNVPATSITLLDSPIVGPAGEPVTVTNALPATAGSDIESDEKLTGRILEKLGGPGGPGNKHDYVVWATNHNGVGYAYVEANWAGPGTVRVWITDVDNNPAPGLVAELKQDLDPSATTEQGDGTAPVGAAITVASPTFTSVQVDALLVLEPGYTITGTAGTRALRAAITDSVRRYIDSLGVGEDVILTKVSAAIVDVEGVADVTSLTLNTVNANLAIGPTNIATLTEPIGLT